MKSQVFKDEVLPGTENTDHQPRKCRSNAIIAGIISEKRESSFAPSHSFCRCTTFWRGSAPHKGLAWLMRRIRSRRLAATAGLPGRRRDFLVQCQAKARR